MKLNNAVPIIGAGPSPRLKSDLRTIAQSVAAEKSAHISQACETLIGMLPHGGNNIVWDDHTKPMLRAALNEIVAMQAHHLSLVQLVNAIASPREVPNAIH